MGSATTDFPLDFRTFRRAHRPNQCLALPEGLLSASVPDLIVPAFEMRPAALRDAFQTAIADEARLELARTSDDGLQIELVRGSRWFDFRDRISVAFVALDPQCSAPALWSRSELGYYDFGVNRARVRRWLERLAAGGRAGRGSTAG